MVPLPTEDNNERMQTEDVLHDYDRKEFQMICILFFSCRPLADKLQTQWPERRRDAFCCHAESIFFSLSAAAIVKNTL